MIRETQDMIAINKVLHAPGIWSAIAPKGVEPFYVPWRVSDYYFMVNSGDGVICFHEFRESCKIHPNFLLEKRGKLAYRAIEESVQVMFSRGYSSIYAEIDRNLRHVIVAARALRFILLEKGERNLYIRRNPDINESIA